MSVKEFFPGGWKGAIGIALIALVAVAVAPRIPVVNKLTKGA